MLARRPYPLIFLCFEKYRYLTPPFDRPAFQQLIQDILTDKIECIVVKDLSRLGRNYITVGYHLEIFFPRQRVRFVSINDQFDTIDGIAN